MSPAAASVSGHCGAGVGGGVGARVRATPGAMAGERVAIGTLAVSVSTVFAVWLARLAIMSANSALPSPISARVRNARRTVLAAERRSPLLVTGDVTSGVEIWRRRFSCCIDTTPIRAALHEVQGCESCAPRSLSGVQNSGSAGLVSRSPMAVGVSRRPMAAVMRRRMPRRSASVAPSRARETRAKSVAPVMRP